MARIGVVPHVVEKVLNHTNGQISSIAEIYNRHGNTHKKWGALQAWSMFLQEIVSEIPLRLSVIERGGR